LIIKKLQLCLFYKYLERIRFTDSLIRKKATGNAKTLAKKLNLSKVGTYKFINELKEEGFPIAYSKKDKNYYYTKDGNLSNFLLGEELSDDEIKPIAGGKSFFKLFADYNYS